jgi:hypothetical protein
MSAYAQIVRALATASLDDAERRALQRFVRLLRMKFAEDLDAVWLYRPRARGERPQDESELQLLVLLRDSSRGDRVTALELLWGAAMAERATESYFSIRICDRASAERRRAMDEFLRREVEPNGIVLSSPAPGPCSAQLPKRARAKRLPSPDALRDRKRGGSEPIAANLIEEPAGAHQPTTCTASGRS